MQDSDPALPPAGSDGSILVKTTRTSAPATSSHSLAKGSSNDDMDENHLMSLSLKDLHMEVLDFN
jgi:hypothetical protein